MRKEHVEPSCERSLCFVHLVLVPRILISAAFFVVLSAELSHSLKVLDRRRNTPKSVQSRSESLCSGLWVPCRIFWACFGPALGPNPIRNLRFPTGSLKVFGALLAQPSPCRAHTRMLTHFSSLFLSRAPMLSDAGVERTITITTIHIHFGGETESQAED